MAALTFSLASMGGLGEVDVPFVGVGKVGRAHLATWRSDRICTQGGHGLPFDVPIREGRRPPLTNDGMQGYGPFPGRSCGATERIVEAGIRVRASPACGWRLTGHASDLGSVLNSMYPARPMRFRETFERQGARRIFWRTGCGPQTFP